MKRIFRNCLLATLALIMSTAAIAQDKKLSADELIEMTGQTSLNALAKGDYQKALDARLSQLQLIENTRGKIDSTYCNALIFAGKCYVRLQKSDAAVRALEEATLIYGNNFSRDDREYAIMLDNLSVYLAIEKRYEESLAKADSSLAIFTKIPELAVSADMSAVLIHVAESDYYLEKYKEATIYQIRALNIIKQMYGEHSDSYVSELEYLEEYQELNGEKEKAQQTREKVERLKKEIEDGVVDWPDLSPVKDAEDARTRRFDAARMADYYTSHYITATKMNEVAVFLFTWTIQSDQCHIALGENEAKLLADDKARAYYSAFIASICRDAVRDGKEEYTEEVYTDAMVCALNYYTHNKKYTGKVKFLENLIKTYNKNPDNLFKTLSDYYRKLKEHADKNGNETIGK